MVFRGRGDAEAFKSQLFSSLDICGGARDIKIRIIIIIYIKVRYVLNVDRLIS